MIIKKPFFYEVQKQRTLGILDTDCNQMNNSICWYGLACVLIASFISWVVYTYKFRVTKTKARVQMNKTKAQDSLFTVLSQIEKNEYLDLEKHMNSIRHNWIWMTECVIFY